MKHFTNFKNYLIENVKNVLIKSKINFTELRNNNKVIEIKIYLD